MIPQRPALLTGSFHDPGEKQVKFSNQDASLLICLFIGCVLIQPAAADDSGFYVEFGGGRSGATESATSLDEDATAFRIAGGYQFIPYLSVDVGYIDFGDFDGDLTDPNGGAVPFSATATGIELALVGRIPIGERFAATARVEQFWWDSEVDIDVSGPTQDDSGDSFAYGAGVELNLSNRFVLTGMWQQFELRSTDIDLFTLGIRWTFGASAGK